MEDPWHLSQFELQLRHRGGVVAVETNKPRVFLQTSSVLHKPLGKNMLFVAQAVQAVAFVQVEHFVSHGKQKLFLRKSPGKQPVHRDETISQSRHLGLHRSHLLSNVEYQPTLLVQSVHVFSRAEISFGASQLVQ